MNIPLRERCPEQLLALSQDIDIRLAQLAGKRMGFVLMIVPLGGDGRQLQLADLLSNLNGSQQVEWLLRDAASLQVDVD